MIIMDKNIEKLSPHGLWKHFAAICAIPHPSHHEEALRDYIVAFAKEQNLEYLIDKAGNIILRKKASPGMEHCKGVILQAHLDMVPQKNSDKEFDFEKDSIVPYIDGEWVKADGTTLGADNGIGLAAILTLFEADSLVHGPLEALLTLSEETGMYGAFGLEPGHLKGKILINLDSETMGELIVGCAGGLDANITLDYQTAPIAPGSKAMRLDIKGLKGGHSGLEIILQRANANKLMARFLKRAVKEHNISLASIDGGGLRNAIPREATAVITLPKDGDHLRAALRQFVHEIEAEYKDIEDTISISLHDADLPAAVFAPESAQKLIDLIYAIPNGVIRMSPIPGLVQTSTNLARVVSDGKQVKMQCLLRSSARSEKFDLGEAVSSAVTLAGGKIELSGAYDGWVPDMDSEILKIASKSYETLYGELPEVQGIHAGLECGIIAGVYPGLDMVSMGPTIKYPHSPDEKVEIDSVDKFWVFLCHTLANLPQ